MSEGIKISGDKTAEVIGDKIVEMVTVDTVLDPARIVEIVKIYCEAAAVKNITISGNTFDVGEGWPIK